MSSATQTLLSIRPLGNRILLKHQKTPDNQGQLYMIAVGNGKRSNVPPFVKVGQTILFAPYAGHEVKDQNGEKFLNLSESDILAIEE